MSTPLHRIAVLLPLLAACTAQSPHLDRQFGQSVSLLQLQQVRHPDAGQLYSTADGMDGRAASSAYQQYQKSFQAPEPQPQAFTIGIGGGSSKSK
jgi:hypothetical protein